MKKIIYLPILIGTLLSCNREQSVSNASIKASSKKITTVTKNGNLLYKINYTGDKLTGYDKFENGTINLKVEISYSNNNLPEKWNYYNSSHTLLYYYTYLFEGNKNLITRRDFYTYNSQNDSYTYNGYTNFFNDASKPDNNLIRADYYDSSNMFSYKYEVEYTDDLGSSISNYYNQNNQKFTVKNWIKDNKKAWDYFLDPFTYQHKTNNISISTTDLNNNTTYGYTATFQYDSDGYPISALYSNSDGTQDNYEFNWD